MLKTVYVHVIHLDEEMNFGQVFCIFLRVVPLPCVSENSSRCQTLSSLNNFFIIKQWDIFPDGIAATSLFENDWQFQWN